MNEIFNITEDLCQSILIDSFSTSDISLIDDKARYKNGVIFKF